MLVNIILAVVVLVGLVGVFAAQRAVYLSTLVRYGSLAPNHPKLPAATAFVNRFGGTTKVDSAALTGIEVSLWLIIVAIILLIIKNAHILYG